MNMTKYISHRDTSNKVTVALNNRVLARTTRSKSDFSRDTRWYEQAFSLAFQRIVLSVGRHVVGYSGWRSGLMVGGERGSSAKGRQVLVDNDGIILRGSVRCLI